MEADIPILTSEQFAEKAGSPDLTINVVPGDDFTIPRGTEGCCRTLHQPSCEHYVAGTLVGISAAFIYAHHCEHDQGMSIQDAQILCDYLCEHCPSRAAPLRQHRVLIDGDALANISLLRGACDLLTASVMATAMALDGMATNVEIHVWLFGEAMVEEWKSVMGAAQAETDAAARAAETMTGAQIEMLPLNYIDVLDEDGQARIVSLGQDSEFHEVAAYADTVMLVPGEIGHDRYARYTVATVVGADGEVRG